MPKIALYIPRRSIGSDRINKIRNMLREECKLLGLEYVEKENDEEYPIIYLEDSETTTFLYIEDEAEESLENIRAMVRVLTLVALLSEEKVRREEVRTILTKK